MLMVTSIRFSTIVFLKFSICLSAVVVFTASALAQLPEQLLSERPSSTTVDLNASSDDEAQAQDFLTRGPLHEAFAGPYEANATPSVFIDREPPEPINELPPDHRPEGSNVLWISGYWAWDEDRSDYLWISGVWRKTPPGQRWIPGYWETVEQGNRWISGFWASDKLAEVDYLPLPPESLEQGPSSPAPRDDYFYIPGNWVYASSDYQWQPGYWAKTQPDWVWSPSQYSWTPSGCVYRQGYWDYDVPARGVVFAPVYYNQPIYQSPNYSYRPQYAIDTGINLFVHLFVRPNQRQYYFGDYYGQQYSNRYQPWVTTYQQRQNYDPFYTHYQNRSRNQNTNVLSWINNQHQFFQNDSRYRPPQTIAAQQQFIQQNQGGSLPASMLRLATFGESFDNLVAQKNSALKFQALTQDEENQFDRSKEPLRELSQSRRKLESQNRKQAANANLNSNTVQQGAELSGEDKTLKPNPKSDQAKTQALDRPRINEAKEKQGEVNRLPNRLSLPKIDSAIPNNNLKPGLPNSLDPLSKDKSNGNNREGRNPTTGQDRNRQDPANKPDAQSLRPAETQGWPVKPSQIEKALTAPPTSPNPNPNQQSKAPLNPESNPVSGLPKGPQNRPDTKSPAEAKGPNERLRQPGNVPKTPDAIQKKLPSGGLPGAGLPSGGLPGVGRAGNGSNSGVSVPGAGAANAGGVGVGSSPIPRPRTESLPRPQQNTPKGNVPNVSNPDRARGNRPPKAPQLPSGASNGSNPIKSLGDSLQKTIDPGTKKK